MVATEKVKLYGVKAQRIVDTDPDFSTIGEFTDDSSDWAIVRHGDYAGQYVADLLEDAELPDRGRECRFFLPYAAGEKPGSKYYKEYGLQDWARAESYENQDWGFVGIRAEAEIGIPHAGVNRMWTIQHIRSGGLWGIESDSEPSYLAEVLADELADLRSQLEALGVNLADWEKLTADLDFTD